MKHVKRSFLREEKTELEVIGTSIQTLANNYVEVKVIFTGDLSDNDSYYIDLSFEEQEIKEESLKTLNVMINDLKELKEQMLNHKFN